MFGRKRRTPEDGTAEDAAQAIAGLLRRCVAWRDRCGKAFLIRAPRTPERQASRVVQRVGRFDRLRCTQLLEVVSPSPGPGYAVTGFEAVFAKGEVLFFVARPAQQPKNKKMATDLMEAEERTPPVPKLPACVEAADEAVVVDACRSLLRATSSAQAKLTFRAMAETYEVSASGAERVDAEGIAMLGRWPLSYVDFESAALVAVVPRTQPVA